MRLIGTLKQGFLEITRLLGLNIASLGRNAVAQKEWRSGE